MPDIEALKDLLPQIEASTDRLADETLGRLVCAFSGMKLDSVMCKSKTGPIGIFSKPGHVDGAVTGWCGSRDYCPDTSTEVADRMVRKVLLGKDVPDEPLAIILALGKAVIAQHEMEISNKSGYDDGYIEGLREATNIAGDRASFLTEVHRRICALLEAKDDV